MVLEPILRPCCQTDDDVKYGQSCEGKQRYQCRNSDCSKRTFILDYSYRAYLPEVKDLMIFNRSVTLPFFVPLKGRNVASRVPIVNSATVQSVQT